MSNLTLKQMHDLGIHSYMNSKEIEKHIGQALLDQEVTSSVETVDEVKPVKLTFEKMLVDGGVMQIKHNDKKYRVSVLTVNDLNILDNSSSLLDNGNEYTLPSVYKFHCTIATGNKFTVKAQTYQEAQEIVNTLFGCGMYRVSASRI